MESTVYTMHGTTPSPNTAKLLLNYITDLLQWWFVQMPIHIIRSLGRINLVLNDRLSILLLLRTFFIPWKRDYQLVGRIMGVVMRLLYIPVALFIVIMVNLVYLAFLVIWLILPIITLLIALFGFILPI